MAVRGTQWGQCVCGPPGTGKSTYCRAMYEMLNAAGRKTIVVNLDPANDSVPYPCAINITDLISVADAVAAYELGPNGALMYCMEFLQENTDWLTGKLLEHSDAYILFDCPGQAELYTHHSSFFSVFKLLQQKDYRVRARVCVVGAGDLSRTANSAIMQLTAVHLVDSASCSEPAKFMSVALLSLITMVRLEMPHVNLLSKVDAMSAFGELDFGLDFFTDVLDMQRLAAAIRDPRRIRRRSEGGETASEEEQDDDDESRSLAEGGSRFMQRYRRLNERVAEIIEDYNLVAFVPISVKDPATLAAALRVVDKSNGYVPLRGGTAAEAAAVGAAGEHWDPDHRSSVAERYTSRFREEM